ncbi:MAG: diguanylate cyclase [Candidatus Obscuribacterales bacterium]|nr:diguanylate cyclase [Candidatus Obscuribacterales bacterium]
MKIDIPDQLYEQYLALIQERLFSDDVAHHVQTLIEFELRKRCVPGYEIDLLTNCKSQYQLELDISRATSGDGWKDHSIYRCNYLCIDIDNFKRIVDVDGMTASDELLQEIGRQLQSKYAGANVYRFGGDEFVVEVKDAHWLPLDLPEQINLKYSIVKVEAEKNQRRNSFVNRVIMYHLERGIVESKREGNEIICSVCV